MRLLVFNPESDLALAANDAHYTPPASARRMAEDLQLLPMFWAESDDVILKSDGTLADSQGRSVGGDIGALMMERLDAVVPWGWNPLVARRLREGGVPRALLPSDTWLAAYRELAGRATAATILGHLMAAPSLSAWRTTIVGEARVCCSLDEAREAHRVWGVTAVGRDGTMAGTLFKQPWSGSGRGLYPATTPQLTDKNEAWLRRTLRTQGYVMAEPIYNKVQDFAAEFLCHDDGRVTFEGLSLFFTTPGGVYDGNLIASEEVKRSIIARHIPLPLLDAVIDVLCSILRPPFRYTGLVGVDMMIVDGGRLHPCVEVNRRMTMGMVALQLARRTPILSPRCFKITYSGGRYEAVVESESPKIDALLKNL